MALGLALLTGDVAVVLLYLWYYLTESRYWALHLEAEAGVGELYQHLKELLLLVVLAALWRLTRAPLVAWWVVVATLLLLGDTLALHERVGRAAAAAGTSSNLGEALVLGCAALAVVGMLLHQHRRAPAAERVLSRRLLGLFGLLGLCAVVVDELHGFVSTVPVVNGAVTIAEEGGELVAVSLLVATAATEFARRRRAS